MPDSLQAGQQGHVVGWSSWAPRELIWEVTRLTAKSGIESGFSAHSGRECHSRDSERALHASQWWDERAWVA